MSAVGLSWKKIRAVLPDWTDDALMHRAGVLEVEGFLARHLGLRLLASGGFERGDLPQACFKLRAGTTPESVSVARQVATSIARLVADAVKLSVPAASFDSRLLRILALASKRGNAGWVDFPGLVDAAWNLGIPVVYLPNVAADGRKPDGMVTYVSGRPVVVLLKSQELADWQLFTLAHEVGHIARKHLAPQEGAAIVDEEVELPSSGTVTTDEQEIEANAFASETIMPSGEVTMPGRWPKAPELAAAAIAHGERKGVSPGHVVLNAIRNTAGTPYALGQAALRNLADRFGSKTTSEVCRTALRDRIDLPSVRDDTQEFLEKLEVL